MPRRPGRDIVAAMLRSTATPTRRLLALLTCAVALAAVLAAPADAAFSGSNGKLAWVDGGQLWVDDPYDDTGPQALTTAAETQNERVSAPASPPAWSPDGTKIAFTDAIPDTSPYKPHTAVFTINADGTGRTKVTSPYPAVVPCDECQNGEQTWDLAPNWTPDGRIAFIRMVAADEEAGHRSQVGTSLWLAGQGSALIHINPANDELLRSFVWPKDSLQAYGVVATARGFELRSLPANTTIARASGITDLDASPDGQRLAYREIGPGGITIRVVARNGGPIHSFDPGITNGTKMRFTPDGNGLLLNGCSKDREHRQHCGWFTHRLPDPDGDVRDTDPVDVPYLDGNPAVGDTVDIPGGRSMVDIQSQDLPVIYAPGFLGSEITCGGDKVWMPLLPPINVLPMRLAANGRDEAACPGAGPTGRPVDSFVGADVYGHADEWLERIDPKGGFATFGWDWRKAPQDSLTRLDERISQLLDNDLPKRQGATRVTLAGHSYGGLLIRTYLDTPAYAKRVARVLTVGSPWWGAPKPVMPLAFGVESPGFSALDLFIDNEDMRTFMQTIPGAYHLLPSDSYGPWLTRDGAKQGQEGVDALLWQVGASRAHFATARQHHRENIDGFYDDGGKIDVRAVVGIGLMTVQGVKMTTDPENANLADVTLEYGHGDITVPIRSATQGPMGTQTPMGDPIHIQQQCRVEHMDQTKDEVLQHAYDAFLVDGTRPRKLPRPSCPAKGVETTIHEDLELGSGAVDPRGRTARAAAATPSLAYAERSGAVDVIRLPGKTVVVSDDSRPGAYTFTARGSRLEITDLEGEDRGTARVYGPVTGEVAVTTAGGAPTVTVDGAEIAPVGGDTDTPAPAPAPAPGGGQAPAPAPAGGGAAPGGSTNTGAAPAPRALSAGLTAGRVLRVDRRGRARVRVTAGAAARGTLTVRDTRGRKLGTATVRLKRAGKTTITVRLSAAARKRLRGGRRVKARLTLALRSGDGRRATVRRTATLRQR